MTTLLIIGWFLLGYVLFVLACWIANKEVTVGDLIMGILGGILGPIGLVGILIAVSIRYGHKKVF
jgi:hypothetical protein